MDKVISRHPITAPETGRVTPEWENWLNQIPDELTALSARITAMPAATPAPATGGAALGHTHPMSDVLGLQPSLDGKSAVGHTHAQAEVSGLVAELVSIRAALDTKATVRYNQSIANQG